MRNSDSTVPFFLKIDICPAYNWTRPLKMEAESLLATHERFAV